MRTACLTLAAALLLSACGDKEDMPTTDDTTAPLTSGDPSGATEETGMSESGVPTTGEPATTTDTDATTAAGDDRMTHYGAPCTKDGDCTALIGPNAVCVKDILGVYELPGGYCSNYCEMPMDGKTTYVPNAPDCFMGADCVGLDGYFEACGVQCTDNSQCPREGYECRRMPTISSEGDPTYCLMTDEHML